MDMKLQTGMNQNTFPMIKMIPTANVSAAYPTLAIEQKPKTSEQDTEKEKKGLSDAINGILGFSKDLIVGSRKMYISITEYASALASGIGKGAILGGLTGIGLFLANKVKKCPFKESLILPISAVVGIITLGITLFNAQLNINEQTARVDHRWNAGHRDKG